MTQGHGPGHGQQPQWGQPEQNAQQPNPPQWGQPPAPSPRPGTAPYGSQAPGVYSSPAAGYPGAAGSGGPAAFSHRSPDPAKRSLAAKLGLFMVLAAVIVVVLRLGTPVYTFITVAAGGAGRLEGENVSMAMGLSSVGFLLVALLNLVVSIALLVLAIISAIQFSGRARIGAIIVVATIVLAVPLSWILGFLSGLIGVIATGGDAVGTMYIIAGIVELLRVVVVGAVLVIGSVMVQRWGKQAG